MSSVRTRRRTAPAAFRSWMLGAIGSLSISILGAAAPAQNGPASGAGAPTPGADAASGTATAPTGTAATNPARPVSGAVMEVEGRVRMRPSADAAWVALQRNAPVGAGAEIQTGIRSSAAIRLGTNATMLLDAGTTVIVPALETDGRVLVTRVCLKVGGADFKVDRVGLDNDFKILTPSTTIAVAGTSLAVRSGQLMGTEVTGARLNEMLAIETRWIIHLLTYYFGDGKSSKAFPDPALHGIDDNVDPNLMPGLIDDHAQREMAWFDGTLQNVIFDIQSLQAILNIPQNQFDQDAANILLLQQLLEIRAKTAQAADTSANAAALAQAFAQKAISLAAMAQAMLPSVEQVIADQTKVAFSEKENAWYALQTTESFALETAMFKKEALEHLAETIHAVENENWKAAQDFANQASTAALFASSAAASAVNSSTQAMAAAAAAASAAATAQNAINSFYSKLSEVGTCAAAAQAQAQIASNAAATAKALDQLAQQLGSAAQGVDVAPILAQISSNTNSAIQSSLLATQARDDALAAAATASTMGQKMLFNFAAAYASEAGSYAAEAGVLATQAILDSLEAKDAAILAQKLAGGEGKGGGN